MTAPGWEVSQTALLLAVTGGLIGVTSITAAIRERLGPELPPSRPLEPGAVAPEQLEQDVRNGKLVSLAERVEGVRFTVVVFLSPTCRACIDDVPALNALTERLDDTRFVAVIEAADGFNFAADLSPALNVVGDRDRQLQAAFGVARFPHGVIIDGDGRIVAHSLADVRDIDQLIEAARDTASGLRAGPEEDDSTSEIELGAETASGPRRKEAGPGTGGQP